MSEKYNSVVTGDVIPLKGNVLVSDLEIGERITSSGIIIPDDDSTDTGIRPRWCRVYSIGKDVYEVKINEWVLVAHGRWTRGVKIIKKDGSEPIVRMVDRNDILLVTDKCPK